MRTTLQFDDDVLAAARVLARQQRSCQATSAFGPLATRKLVHLAAC
jgi:hypothetical protein